MATSLGAHHGFQKWNINFSWLIIRIENSSVIDSQYDAYNYLANNIEKKGPGRR